MENSDSFLEKILAHIIKPDNEFDFKSSIYKALCELEDQVLEIKEEIKNIERNLQVQKDK